MKKFLIMALIAASVSLSSCNTDVNDPDYTVGREYTNCFYTVKDVTDNSTFYQESSGVFVEYNYTKMTGAITLKNIPKGPGSSADFHYLGLHLKATNHGTLTFEETEFSADGISITDFKLDWYDNKFDNIYHPVVVLSFTVNGRYQVTVVPATVYLKGSTEVTSPGGEKFTTDAPNYIITLNPKTGLANISLRGAKFADKMPGMDMNFADIAFHATQAGITFATEKTVPTIAGTPYENFAILNLSGVIAYNWQTSLNFTVGAMGTVKATLTK